MKKQSIIFIAGLFFLGLQVSSCTVEPLLVGEHGTGGIGTNGDDKQVINFMWPNVNIYLWDECRYLESTIVYEAEKNIFHIFQHLIPLRLFNQSVLFTTYKDRTRRK